MRKDVVIIGGGAHAFSVADLLCQKKKYYRVLGYVDRNKTTLDLPYLGTDKEFLNDQKSLRMKVSLLMGIGIDVKLRSRLFDLFQGAGFSFLTLVQSTAFVNSTAQIGEGTVVFSGAMIGPKVVLGKNVVIHTQAVLEHRAFVGDHSYLSPGVMVCGECCLGQRNFLGARSTLVEDIALGDDIVVGAGAVVLKSVSTKGSVLIGLPAKEMSRENGRR